MTKKVLQEELDKKQSELNNVLCLLDYVDNQHNRQVGEIIGKRRKLGHYDYIPFPAVDFCYTLKACLRDAEKRGIKILSFVDYGSGPGLKLRLASLLYRFPAVLGYEFSEDLIAKRMHHGVRQLDILQLTEADIPAGPQIAYYYCPLANDLKQNSFSQNLWDLLPVNSYVMSFACRSPFYDWKKRFEQVKDKKRCFEAYIKVSP